jgi:hypothetical protein
MTKPTSEEEEFSFFKKPTTKTDFLIWSYMISLALMLFSTWLETNTLDAFWTPAFEALVPAIFLFLSWLFVHWVASTAEIAGRSFVAFMIFAIIAPVIAWVVVIMFKKPQSTGPTP